MCEFSIPSNYSAPDGVKKGDEFSEIATFKIDGKKIMITSIGQDKTPVGGKEDGKPKGAKDAIKDQLKSMEDKKGSASMEDTEGSEEDTTPEEE